MVLALVLVVALAGNAFAYISTGYMWTSYFSYVWEDYHTSDLYKPNIKTVQKIVDLYPNSPDLDEDGIFGPNTTNGVRSFQTERGLSVDGQVGQNTWGNMQYRMDFGHTGVDGYDYYKVDTSVSDNGTSTSGEYFKHQTNGRWYYRKYTSSSWERIDYRQLP